MAAPARVTPSTPAVEPLTADLRRLHLTVSKGFLDRVAAARTGLSHALPGATTEKVLEAALDLLLEKQARAKALAKRPRKARLAEEAAPVVPNHGGTGAAPPKRTAETTTGDRPPVPATIQREVRLRDGDRCTFPLDGGGTCGSTWQVELDHVVPLARGGATTAANLRCLCQAHHRRESDRTLGALARQRTRR